MLGPGRGQNCPNIICWQVPFLSITNSVIAIKILNAQLQTKKKLLFAHCFLIY